MKEREEITHKSFGQISFSRTHSNGTRFYGSELSQNNYISFEISNSTKIKELGFERYSPSGTPTIIRGRMTAGQFAEMITSMNCEGIPCTLEYINGYKVENLPEEENYKEFNIRKFEERMINFSNKFEEVRKNTALLVKKPKLSKEDKRVLLHNLEWIHTEIARNIPYFAKEFQDQTDKVVLEAKTEIENAMLHKVTQLGLQALEAKHLKELGE